MKTYCSYRHGYFTRKPVRFHPCSPYVIEKRDLRLAADHASGHVMQRDRFCDTDLPVRFDIVEDRLQILIGAVCKSQLESAVAFPASFDSRDTVFLALALLFLFGQLCLNTISKISPQIISFRTYPVLSASAMILSHMMPKQLSSAWDDAIAV